MDLKIDDEFREILRGLEGVEREQLERNIIAAGEVYDDIVVWGDIVVDGMHRYAIASEHGLPYKVRHAEFSSRREALTWIVSNQLGRRNLSQVDRAVLRNALVNAKVESGEPVTHAVASVAKQEKVSVSTINKDRRIADKVATGVPGSLSSKRAVLHASQEEDESALEDGAQKYTTAADIQPPARDIEGKVNKTDNEVKATYSKLIRLVQDRGKLTGQKDYQRSCLESLSAFHGKYRRWRGER
jgi:hypothetical protein